MLNALRGRAGWPRVLTLVLLFAFSAGLLHAHAIAIDDLGADAATLAAVATGTAHGDHNHDNGGSQEDSAAMHCSFCAVVCGKYCVPAQVGVAALRHHAVENEAQETAIFSPITSDLFRPPIAPSVG